MSKRMVCKLENIQPLIGITFAVKRDRLIKGGTMRRSLVLVVIYLAFSTTVHAVPNLQLGIAGGTYVNETTVTSSSTFDLYAYLLPNTFNTIADTYYLSAALIRPDYGAIPPGSLGSININGTFYNVTKNMLFGTPPIDEMYGELERHGIFPTFYIEQSFSFFFNDKTNRAINVANAETQSTEMYRHKFLIDLSGLTEGYGIHFDLYNLNAREKHKQGLQYEISEFAPYSHDAEGMPTPTPVPEPDTIVLLVLGLAGVTLYRRAVAI